MVDKAKTPLRGLP